MVLRNVPWVEVAVYGGQRAYTLLKKTISPGENGLWQYDDEFKRTKLIHFTCPYCASIQSIHKGDIERWSGNTAVEDEAGRIYQSVWCVNKLQCARHLWIRFRGFRR